ncbi:MAG: ComEC/Rec2 family competence protein [Coriobacteriales bacterium]|nr:ComEC/Rec2 family competence protein [Coriobacteriales bacterium]
MRGIIVQDGVDGGGWRSDGAALLLGIDLGDRSLIRQSDLQQDFRICGLSHMLAVSGTHLVIVAALMSWAFEKMRMGKGVKAVLLSFALITYVFLSGLQTSAIRSCIMAITGTFAERAKRRRDPLSSCALTIMLLLGQDPSTAFDFSFRLSVCAVLGIICFSRYLEAWILCLTPKSMQGLANPLAVTLAAQGATMPLIVSGFSCLPLLSPVSNLIIAPLLSVTLGASLIMLPICLIIPSMQSVLMALPLFLGGLIARIASLLALIPNSNLPICCDQGTALLCMTILSATLWFFWPQPSRRRAQWASVTICSAALALACVPILPLSPRMIVLDVGQGDAILIRDGRRTVLIDAGPMDDALLKALARQHVRHIDCLIITHPHEDHYGGIVRLRGAVTIDELIMPGPMLDRDFPAYDVILPLFDDDRIHPMHVGQRLKLKHMEITMLGPSELTDEGDNQDSLILFVDVDADSDGTGDAQVLLTGDAEAETLERPEHAYDLSCVDVFKLGHHGSAVSIDRDTLREMDPHCVLISVGRDNDYGHPDPNVLSLLEDAGVTVGRTDMMGDLTVTFASASVSLRCDTMGP